MDGRKIVKRVSSLVIGAGITQIVFTIVDAHVPQDSFLKQEVPVTAAKLATTMVLKDVIQERVDAKIDKACDYFDNDIKPSFQEKLEEKRKQRK